MSEVARIKWTTETRRLGDLIKWEPNPRQLTKEQAVRLRRSIAKFGYSQLYEIEPDNTIIDGHQRDEIMLRMDEYGADAEIEVRVAPYKMTLEERKEYIALKHQGAVGEWDWEAIHNLYDSFEQLEDFGFDVDELLAHGFVIEEDEKYTRNIEAPIYEPKGPKPRINELYDDSRTNELIQEIDSSELPEDEKEFLKIAAGRHTIFNYRNIANYYAYSDKEAQELIENSALVIIDFGKAIELGYVKLSEEIAEQYRVDYIDA